MEGLDILFVRELTGGIYFGEPRGIDGTPGPTHGVSTPCAMMKTKFRVWQKSRLRRQKSAAAGCGSVDKANVLEVSMLWREVVEKTARQYPDVKLSHMYVDNAAMQLVRSPKKTLMLS